MEGKKSIAVLLLTLKKKCLLSVLVKIFKLFILLMYFLDMCHFVDKIFILCLILSVALYSVDTGKLFLQVKQRMLQSSECVFLKFCVHCIFWWSVKASTYKKQVEIRLYIEIST